MESFFDMPAGYNDADMEMAELVERGNRDRAKEIARGLNLCSEDDCTACSITSSPFVDQHGITHYPIDELPPKTKPERHTYIAGKRAPARKGTA